ncbi:MAG: LysR family transcriptional regulator [Pseudomonadota bacterium]
MDWHDIPSLSALRAFEAAVRLGSFSAASRELNVTHAAIAQHVRTLETHYGQSLMQRDGRGMIVTPEGRPLADALNEAFATIGAASRDLTDRTKTRALRVAVTPSFAANWLMPRIGKFWDTHPDIELEVLPSQRLVDLRHDSIDVAIRYGTGGWSGVTSTPLMAAGHMAVATPDYVGTRATDCLADLKGSRWLLDGARSEERLWLTENGIDLEAETVTTFATGQLMREAARAGLGIAIMPAPIAAPLLESGVFVELCSEQESSIAYHIVIRPNVISKNRDIFIKWLKSEAAN